MQITLVQSEIEQALKNYINEQVNVKEGMDIVIVLKATRGEEGTTAVIDITKPVAVVPTAPQKRAVAVKAEPKPEPQPTPEVKPSAEKEEPPFDPDTPAQASAPESSASTDGAAATTGTAENVSAEPAPKKPSLFAGLGK